MTGFDDVGLDPSDSQAQRDVEAAMLESAKGLHWCKGDWSKIADQNCLPEAWKRAQPDGVWETANGGLVLVESYARIEKLKPGHRRKVAMDVLKLSCLRRILGGYPKVRCLLVVPEQIRSELLDKSWLAAAICDSVEVIFVELTEDHCAALKRATRRQADGQARRLK